MRFARPCALALAVALAVFSFGCACQKPAPTEPQPAKVKVTEGGSSPEAAPEAPAVGKGGTRVG